MILLILFLFLNGAAAQEPQAVLVDKLDKLLAGQETLQTHVVADIYQNANGALFRSINAKIEEGDQTLVARLDSIILEVQSVQLIIEAATGFNKTLNQLMAENKTLKRRQAAAAILQVCQFLIVILYFLVVGVIYLVKCVKKQQAEQLEENLEMMDYRLQERKTQRRSAARPPKAQ